MVRSASASRSTRPPAPSRVLMPHVFVVPPEEEQLDNPPWCCFDADGQPGSNDDLPSNPNIHSANVPHLSQPSENDPPTLTSRRTSVHQPRPRASMSRKLEKKQRPEAVKIIENRLSLSRQKGALGDSDVIEVVKVKRARETLTDLEENAKIKRSKTLKARATRALQSIKNVGKGSHRTHVKELWTSTENMPGISKGIQEQFRSQQDQTEEGPPASPSKKRSLSRSSSRSLSQIFHPLRPSRSESAFAVRVETSVTFSETDNALPSSLSRFKYDDINSSFVEISSAVRSDDALNTVSSSTSTKKKLHAKFSVRELHRLFSFASPSPDDSSSRSTASTMEPSLARGSSIPLAPTSALSSDHPNDPMEEDNQTGAQSLGLGSADPRFAQRHHRALHTHHEGDLSAPSHLSDFSFEMKLDSLHFDALSFDPEDYDVSMEGNVLR